MSARHLAGSPQHLHGLPERLPAGETLLWQGAPSARALLLRAFHLRAVALYFAAIIAASAAVAARSGASRHALELMTLHRLGFAAVPCVLIVLYAWAIQRSTTYSITSQRVVLSFGIALPMSFNLPFSRIGSAALRLYADGSGDIPLRLLPGERLGFFVMWPHARPWRMARTEPMLRCLPEAQTASTILSQALAAHAQSQAQLSSVSRRAVRLTGASGLRGGTLAA